MATKTISHSAMELLADAMNTENVYRALADDLESGGESDRANTYYSMADAEMTKFEAMVQVLAAQTGITQKKITDAVCDFVGSC